MPMPPCAAAVLYAKDLSKIGNFYAQVAGLQIIHEEPDHIVLESDAFQLVVVAIPGEHAASIHITEPPQRRENIAIKLAFPVASITATRQMAQLHGGEFNSPSREWLFQGARVCDGQDPEGNVVQFRESVP
ncbi:VOC family protein [Rhodanobacter hydrolyticus]|uniref:Glyoxalase/fosfomycin resistance/dioxygenase domain-containing protein n=1 Tax=Rhodanobacter hydrolyticus TaxID=2250595 RepID=A0ABW8J7S1_9GAMM